MNIPYLDLKTKNSRIRPQIMRAIGEVLASGTYCSGAVIDAFEHAFAHACGTKHAVAVGSGTEALWFALLAHGISHGDEVITAAISSIPTIEAICLTGARPVFADVDPRTYTIDPEALARAVNPRTKAVMPGHLFGQMAEMDAILEIAIRHGVAVIEDAADAPGADDLGRKAGSLGDCGCFSFHPSKC
jgi:dTDP-4-amino-4,6-dideoxygalactose transaminase